MMERNILLAGVGGQGILTIARSISLVAMERGLHVKQSEVHGMSQRGGAVQAHLRYSDHPIGSDLIPLGKADILLAVEPMEALRYTDYLCETGVIVANCVPVENIPHYPPIDNVLDRIAQIGEHVVLDARKLARLAGSARAENVVMLGAVTLLLDFSVADFERQIGKMFAAKGDRVVEVNHRALRMGRRAAAVFFEGLRSGQTSRGIVKWMDQQPADSFAELGAGGTASCALSVPSVDLPENTQGTIGDLLLDIHRQGRTRLFEHEVYRIVDWAGAIAPPRHAYIENVDAVTQAALDVLPGSRVVLKVVSPDIAHKTEAGGVTFVTKSLDAVREGVRRLMEEQRAGGGRIEGVLLVEFLEQADRGLGSELFVGIRRTREFGPVIAAGLGGIDTEFLASKMRPGIGVAKASAVDTTPEEFFDIFRGTAAYEILAGKVRGHERQVDDGELIRCFRAFIAVARRFCRTVGQGLCIEELEVNPFAFRRQRLVPLDGRGRLMTAEPVAAPRPLESVARMLEPQSIAVVGVSANRPNFGRVILNNVRQCGFPTDRLYVIKQGIKEIDGIQCVPSVGDLPERVDLLVAATSADRAVDLTKQILPPGKEQAKCASVVLVSGGLGEKEGTRHAHDTIRQSIQTARQANPTTPVFLGGNCMGVRSHPGNYDTFFIPPNKLDPPRDAAASAKRCAVISQSGAFLITRMSNLECLEPSLAISVGNQVDLTVTDLLLTIADRDDLDVIGVYVEGFNDLDGLAFIRAVDRAVTAGKTVVFYKAGRTGEGRSAAMGHTASVAGDYDVCQAAVAAAGAMVTDTFKEFEQLLELATNLHDKPVRGKRIAAVSNAGYEAVGMADAIKGARYELQMPALDPSTRVRLANVLKMCGLQQLVDAKNPLDLTPMADDDAYEEAVRVLLDADEIDAVVLGCVPMTPQLLTTPGELLKNGSIVDRIPSLFTEARKPLVFVVDSAGQYDELARSVRRAGVPVFRTADQAVRSLGRYLNHRTGQADRAERRVRLRQTNVALPAPVTPLATAAP